MNFFTYKIDNITQKIITMQPSITAPHQSRISVVVSLRKHLSNLLL